MGQAGQSKEAEQQVSESLNERNESGVRVDETEDDSLTVSEPARPAAPARRFYANPADL